jgi:hypothetical protein
MAVATTWPQLNLHVTAVVTYIRVGTSLNILHFYVCLYGIRHRTMFYSSLTYIIHTSTLSFESIGAWCLRNFILRLPR